MAEEPTWFEDATTLLHEVRRTRTHWGQAPDIPGYDNLVELRRGGQGIIYRARQRSTNRVVAIKVLLDGVFASDASRLRFQRETLYVARLRHPNIVRIFDSGTTPDGRLYYVMEYVSGAPLDSPDHLQGGEPRGLLERFLTICDAVHYAHQRGIIHRDLKPGNILIDERGAPQILDFGLAKIATEEARGGAKATTVSQTGQILGSLAWASPEQIDAAPDRIDVRTDVYSLGAILYQLLTGRLPHAVTGNLRETLNAITLLDPPRPRSIRRDIPADLETIVLRCLAKEPQRRYQSVGELARDLRHFLAGEPIDAKRDETWYVLRRLLARHKAVSALSTLLLVFILGFAVTMSFLYQRAVAAESAARSSLEQARSESAKSTAVREFLERMLQAADPFLSRDPELTVREVLDRANRQIEHDFENLPEVEAEIRSVIGRTYLSLGDLDQAERHFNRALEIRRGLHADAHPDVAQSLYDLARVRMEHRDYAQAEELLQQALDMNRATSGEDSVSTAECLLSLADLRQAQFRHEEARTLIERAHQIFQARLGPDDDKTLSALILEGTLLNVAGQPEAAEGVLRRALEAIRSRGHGEDPLLVGTLISLAASLNQRGMYADAEPLLIEASQVQRALYGDEHPRLAEILNNLGTTYRLQERLDEAEQAYRDSLAVADKTIGRQSAEAGQSLWNIGMVYWMRGDLERAQDYFQQGFDIRRNVYDPGHHFVAMTAFQTGKLFREAGDCERAVPFLEQAVQYGGEVEGAGAVFAARVRAELGACLVELGEYERAEGLLLGAYETLSSAHGAQDPPTIEAAQALTRLYTLWDRPNEADKWRSAAEVPAAP